MATQLPPGDLLLVLGHLPMPELARLSCVHKAFRVAWRCLQEQHPGKRYAPPSADDIKKSKDLPRMERASAFGDVTVIQAMFAAGVDEHGKPLLQAGNNGRAVDQALWRAAELGHLQAVELLLDSGVDVHSGEDAALRWASHNGHAAVVQLLLQHGDHMPIG